MDAADLLIRLRDSIEPLAALPAAVRPLDLAAGYQLQRAIHARRGDRVGWKIGCTTGVMQAYMKITHPCAGGIRAGDVHERTLQIDTRAHRRLGIECELAVRLAQPLDGSVDHTQARAAIGDVMAAIELVEDRYVDWPTMDLPTLVADDFFQRAAILGAPIANWQARDLNALVGTLEQTGRMPVSGRGADILGDPLNALIWLAGHTALSAGSVILLGSVVQTQWIGPGERACARFDGDSTAEVIAL